MFDKFPVWDVYLWSVPSHFVVVLLFERVFVSVHDIIMRSGMMGMRPSCSSLYIVPSSASVGCSSSFGSWPYLCL